MPRVARATSTKAAPPQGLTALPKPRERQERELPSAPKRLGLPKPTRLSDDHLLVLALLALAALVFSLWLKSRTAL